MRYEFTMSDLKAGALMVCVKSMSRDYVPGCIYKVAYISMVDPSVCIISSENGGITWSLVKLNSNIYSRLIPYEKLDDKDKLVYKLSGRMPGLDHYLDQ